jgi:hypothetical protein
MKTLNCNIPLFFLFPAIVMVLSACSLGPVEYGVLEGQVSIGPLVPVVQEGEDPPTPAPEVYSARQIVIFKKNGKTEFTRLEIDPQGHYQAQLPVGIYVVDINRIGIDSAEGLPLEISISADRIFTLDIEIDTGIR